MAIAVTMPRFGQDQIEGTIVEWFKEEGEHVEQGEPLLSVETDKTTMDVEAPASGVLLNVKYGPEDVVPVTEVIAYLGEPGETILDEAPTPEKEKAPAEAPSADAPAPPVGEARPEARPGKVRATPTARRLARERGIEIALVTGTGRGGLITPEDVQVFPTEAPIEESTAKKAEVVPLKGIRKTIATRMLASWQSAPHITFTVAIDMTAAEARRAEWNQERAGGEPKLSVTGLLISAVAGLLGKHRYLNATIRDESVLLHDQANIGLAVALEEGLIVPVLHGAEGLSLEEVVPQVENLSRKARNGKLTPDDVAGSTFTISNLGMFGIEQFTAIINPPESAILAVGRTAPEVTVINEMLAIRSIMRITLSVDHRVADGAQAGRFLSDLKAVLERPDSLFDGGAREAVSGGGRHPEQ